MTITDDIYCCSCEQGPGDYLCERCAEQDRPLSSLIHPDDQAGHLAYLIVVRPIHGLPVLAKAFPMDPSPVGRQLEGVPVSMGAFWATRAEADTALALFVPAADRPSYMVQEVILFYTRESSK